MIILTLDGCINVNSMIEKWHRDEISGKSHIEPDIAMSNKQQTIKFGKKLALQRCKTSALEPIRYHSMRTEFLHPSLKLKCFNPTKGQGIITTEKIKFGTILAVDYPLFTIPDKQTYQEYFDKSLVKLISYVNGIIDAVHESDPEFMPIWQDLSINGAEFYELQDSF